MNHLMVFAAWLLSVQAIASINSYELDMQLSMNGKLITSPRMIVLEGEHGKISQKSSNSETFIDVVATEAQKNGIMMRFKVGYFKNGEKIVMAEPAIVAADGEPAKIQVSEHDNNAQNIPEFALSVTAKRKK